MGEVICVFRLMPEGLESFEKLKRAAQALGPERLEEEPVAFGLKAIKFTKIIPDKEGCITELEEKLKKLEGIQSLETVMVSRAL